MPRNISHTAVNEVEPLLFAAGLDAVKSVVIDASLVPADPANNNRRILQAGTLLTKAASVSPTGADQYKKYAGSGLIEGVLALSVEFIDGTANSDNSRGMFYHGCVFRASKIVDYSTYGLAAISTLNTCKFENV